MKKVYYNYFRSYYRQKKAKVGDLFKPVFQQTSNYEQMLVEQSNFEEYIRIRHIYFEKNSNHRVSVEFRKDMIQLIRLENSNKEECQEYLVKRFKEKFDNDKYISEYNLSQVISEFYELCLQEEQTNLKNKQETQTFNYNNYSDSGSGSGSGSDGGSDGNRYHTSYKSSSHSSSSSSRSNNTYKSNNSSKNV